MAYKITVIIFLQKFPKVKLLAILRKNPMLNIGYLHALLSVDII